MSRAIAHAFDIARAPAAHRVADTWAKKALRAYARAQRTKSREALLDGEEHRHEALEHAALVGDNGRTVARIQRLVDAAREKAWKESHEQEQASTW